MTIPISFAKYSGCGNDFIIIDNRIIKLSLSQENVMQLCHRNYGIGADGVILLENGVDAAYRMRIFNADGSEAEMCGNGLRCLASFISSMEDKNFKFLSIDTMHQKFQAFINEDSVKVYLPAMHDDIAFHKLSVTGENYTVYSIDTGVPHAVIFVEDLRHPKLWDIAPLIRNHEIFRPRGTNVNFAKIMSENTLSIRTYERGVEKETLACGTGAIATALTAAFIHKLNSPIKIQTRSKDLIEISFEGSFPNISDLTMTGPVKKTFEGSFQLTHLTQTDI